jgi:hypothetical protein
VPPLVEPPPLAEQPPPLEVLQPQVLQPLEVLQPLVLAEQPLLLVVEQPLAIHLNLLENSTHKITL